MSGHVGTRPGRRAVLPTVVAVVLAAALVVAAVLAALAVTGRIAFPGHCATRSPGACTRVLFIGNSYTSVNDLPGTFAEVARSSGHDVEVGMAAVGGATLADHVASADTRITLGAEPWDVVLLQEQSAYPAAESSRVGSFEPAVRALVGTIESRGARAQLLETWAYRDGDPEIGIPDYASMQARLAAAYLGIARKLGIGVAPAGAAWAAVRAAHPAIELWQADGSHPAAAGTYLAACVVYAAVFGASPVGLGGGGDLPGATRRTLQEAAAATVLTDPAAWGLPLSP